MINSQSNVVNIPDSLLLSVQKPARYIGGESGSIYKDLADVDVRYCFCFPDVYDIGMCHLGLQILYSAINQFPNVYCERCFAPWTDMEEKMRKKDIPLYSLETFTKLSAFDFLGFTLQYEMSYTNILNMLDLAKVPLYAKDRTDEDPLVIVGGPNAYNPEPMADFVDLVFLGEGEVGYKELFEVYSEHKKSGFGRRAFLEKAAQIKGIYVPSLYKVTYEAVPALEGLKTPKIHSIEPISNVAPSHPTKIILNHLDDFKYPDNPLIPTIQVIQDRAAMEIFRGCLHGCRFCQAGMVYRPVRKHSKEAIMAWVDNVLKNTGYDELSLTSLSSDDYPGLFEIIREIHEKYPNVHISLPSLRVDAFSLELMNELSQGKKSSLTFAAEAGSQHLRDTINKGITETEILDSVELAFKGGFDKVKLYFMLGLPTETYEDIEGIATLSKNVVYRWTRLPKEEKSFDVRVTSSTSFYVPKPFTPFQWCAQDSMENFEEKRKFLTEKIQHKKIKYDCHSAYLSMLEGLISRGDRRTGNLIYTAWKKGCRFDSWQDQFKRNLWDEAIAETGIEIAYYCTRERSFDEVLPWDHLDVGVSRQFLEKEYEKAMRAETTEPCNHKCNQCGMLKLAKEGVCYEKRA